MTPKDKAKELFMRNFEITVDDYCAKQCALIAVDEILKLDLHDVGDYRNDQSTINDFSTVTWYINYWEEVKQEIINQ
jgi:hypothetical protein